MFYEGYLGFLKVNQQFFLFFWQWSSKLNLEWNTIPKCLRIVVILTMLLSNIKPGWFLCEVLRLNMISWACFVGSGIKLIFHCRVHSFISERLLFNRLAESVIILTAENSGVSSAKSLTLELKPLDKSLIQIKNSKGPRIDPWGTPALTFAHEECWPFNTTLWFYSSQNLLLK